MEKKNVAIYVAGQRFSIATTDGEDYVKGIGEKVDLMIKGIAKDNPRLNRDSCAILTALNFCDDETKLRQMMEVLREQVKDYINSNETLRAENAKLKEELESLRSNVKIEEEAKEEEKADKAPAVTTASIPVPTRAEAIIAADSQTRQTAFVGKDFKKNKKNKHKHQKNNFINSQPVVPAPVVKAEETPAQADTIEDNSPYHQFSIFDDLM